MKTVVMDRDYDYKPTKQRMTAYKAGMTYKKQPNAAADAIVEAGAGRVIGDDTDEPQVRRGRK